MKQFETIAAIATPYGKSALAIIRLSGWDVFQIVSRCLIEQKQFTSACPRTIGVYTLVDPEKRTVVDEITAIKYAAPRSFTGEDMVEVICHGGPRVVEEIVKGLLAAGAKPAGRGDFTRRAFENDKIDLLRAEAIKGMIDSTGDIDLACARKLYHQGHSLFNEWRNELLELCAAIEVSIEFGEEDPAVEINEKTRGKINEFIGILEKEIEKRKKICIVENYLQVVLVGPPNAGKSSLFNLLLGHDRTIVHCDPGTTRDIVSERVLICGYQVLLIDSAGIRETMNEIENEGIRRARNAMKNAGLVLWVTNAIQPFSNEEIDEMVDIGTKELICVINKQDLSSGERKKEFCISRNIEFVEISVLEKTGIDKLIQRIGLNIEAIIKSIEIPDLLLNKRQEDIGTLVLKEICSARDEWKRAEIASCYLKSAINCLDEILGKTDNEEVLNKIFSSFCVGK